MTATIGTETKVWTQCLTIGRHVSVLARLVDPALGLTIPFVQPWSFFGDFFYRKKRFRKSPLFGFALGHTPIGCRDLL